MFVIRHLLYLFVVIVFRAVKANYVVINWNVSTDRGNSHIEREYKYPMYEDIASATCDLTDACDVFCQQDPDCDEVQKLSFPTPETNSQCDGPLSVFDCGCDKFEKPEWFPLLCYIYKNPIYLGMFYKTAKKIEKFGSLKNLIARKHQNMFLNQEMSGKTNKLSYQYGSPIMSFIPMSEAFPSVSSLLIKLPLKDYSYACQSKPVSYGFNTSTICLTIITQELCQNGYALSVLPFLVQGSNQSANSDIPIVLKDLNVLKGIKTKVEIKCVELVMKEKKLRKLNLNYFQKKNSTPCYELFDTYETVYADGVCRNVLVYVQYDFILNGSDIVKLNVEYGLGDVAIHDEDFSDVIYKYIYLQQKFEVSFFDTMTHFNKNIPASDEFLNRGYFVGEELNFGYKHTDNSSVSWKRGLLGVFKSGKSCDDFSPITFGFDYISRCHIEEKFSNCSHLRDAAEKKFEALLKGDSLAVWGNLRHPYNNTAPLLRSFLDSNASFENNSGCSVPLVQDIRIRYTSVPVGDGRLVHRVLGVRVDRSFGNVSLDLGLSLTSRVVFSYVSSAKDKRRSRFWQRMLSPESSENAWLYILNGFDDVSSNEREEITFWFILLAVLVSAGIACVGLDVDFVIMTA